MIYLLLAGLYLVFLLLFTVGSRKIDGITYIVISVILLQAVSMYAWNEVLRNSSLIVDSQIPDHFDFPVFTSKPNVYIVFFDSLVPEAIAEKFLGIEKLDYVAALRNEGAFVFRNAFADRVPTNSSFSSFLGMDLRLFDDDWRTALGYDTGENPSPFYEIFRRNGYKIQLVYESSYFGQKSRANLDFYGISDSIGICTHIDSKFAFMGFCHPSVEKHVRRFFGASYDGSNELYPRYLFDRIKTISQSENAWLTLSYIVAPAHTDGDYDPYNPDHLKKYKRIFRNRQSVAAKHITDLIQTVKQHDPDSILAVLGDHGMWVSRGLNIANPTE